MSIAQKNLLKSQEAIKKVDPSKRLNLNILSPELDF